MLADVQAKGKSDKYTAYAQQTAAAAAAGPAATAAAAAAAAGESDAAAAGQELDRERKAKHARTERTTAS
jgi:hypothetical protein